MARIGENDLVARNFEAIVRPIRMVKGELFWPLFQVVRIEEHRGLVLHFNDAFSVSLFFPVIERANTHGDTHILAVSGHFGRR